jgi:hypothetical protein
MEAIMAAVEAVDMMKEPVVGSPVSPKPEVVASTTPTTTNSPTTSVVSTTPTTEGTTKKRETWFSYCFELGLKDKSSDLITPTYWKDNYSKFFSYQPKSIELMHVPSKEQMLLLARFKGVSAPKKEMEYFKQVFSSQKVTNLKRKNATFESMGYKVEKL